jgi:ubiquinone/menaquinone biosynthesis C-methylase UbiE
MTEWSRSVEKYHSYGLNFPQYTETNSKLVEIAELEEGQKIVDLAAGTGFTSKAVLNEQENLEIYAVDKSKEMLQKAEEYLKSENIKYIKSTAENLSQAIPTQVDRVLCNSAIWYFNLEISFKEISEILKHEGILVFNLNQQFYEGNSES